MKRPPSSFMLNSCLKQLNKNIKSMLKYLMKNQSGFSNNCNNKIIGI